MKQDVKGEDEEKERMNIAGVERIVDSRKCCLVTKRSELGRD